MMGGSLNGTGYGVRRLDAAIKKQGVLHPLKVRSTRLFIARGMKPLVLVILRSKALKYLVWLRNTVITNRRGVLRYAQYV